MVKKPQLYWSDDANQYMVEDSVLQKDPMVQRILIYLALIDQDYGEITNVPYLARLIQRACSMFSLNEVIGIVFDGITRIISHYGDNTVAYISRHWTLQSQLFDSVRIALLAFQQCQLSRTITWSLVQHSLSEALMSVTREFRQWYLARLKKNHFSEEDHSFQFLRKLKPTTDNYWDDFQRYIYFLFDETSFGWDIIQQQLLLQNTEVTNFLPSETLPSPLLLPTQAISSLLYDID